MPKLDQLEIICPDGNIFFHDLDPEKGITNIGQHPDNDIVIDSPSIGAFQAVLDHQRKPFRIMVLSKDSTARLGGQTLEPNVFQELRDWQSVDLDGFTLTLLENMDVPARTTTEAGEGRPRLTISEDRAKPSVETPVKMEVAAPAVAGAAGIPAALISMRPPDEKDELIVVDLSTRERTVPVEQVASYELSIANGGPIVASFDVMVEGVNPDWVTIYPQRVNLNEGSQGSVLISIIPPRQTTSAAGEHHLAISVTSPNYAGHVSRLGATLNIDPYFEFSVGNLSPAQQSVTWQKKASTISLPVVNQGNDASSYQIIAQDSENGCRFEFPLEGQASLLKQVEVKVPPGKALDVPIKITPLKRDLVRLRPKQYQYSVTTQSLSESTAIRTVAGTFTSRPLFGPLSVLLAVILVLIGIFFLFQPRIFSLTATPDVVTLGSPVTLSWKTSLFTSNLQFTNLPDVIQPSQNQLSVTPTTTLTTYTMVARNWLSTLLSLPDVTMSTNQVLAIPPMPVITTFGVDKTDVIQGQEVTVKWSIQNATEAVLTVEGVPTTLSPEELNGEKTIVLNNNSLIVLEAKNASGSVFQSNYVRVWSPSDLKVNFTVTPEQVTAGDPVTVSWDVSGAGFTVDTVSVAPFDEPLPAKYSLQYFPTESMYFVLKVNVRDYVLSVPKYVTVQPADAQPTINYFKANPPNLTATGTVEFSWSVSGPTDSITISDKNGVVKDALDPEGFADITVGATGTYVLTASKGKQSSAAVVEVQVNSLKDVNIAITSMVPQLGISRGDTVFVYFSLTPKVADPTGPEISGTVVITDGFDSCEVKLPITSCEFVFNRSGTNKQLTATYSGDSNFRRTTSAAYPSNSKLTVYGSTVSISNINIVYTQPVLTATNQLLSAGIGAQLTATGPEVGQTGYLVFDLTPTSATATPVQGNFDVLAKDLDVTTADPVPVCLNGELAIAKDAEGNNIGRGVCKFVFGTTGNKAFLVNYKGNEIFDAFNSDYTDPNQTTLKIAVSKATTQVISLSQVPPRAAQVGQQVTLTLQAVVAAQGGIPVPGVGTITVKDDTTTYCQIAVDKNGTVVCSFVPTKTIAALTISYKGDGLNYSDSDSTNTIKYAVTTAKADVAITAFQFTPVNPANKNPTVGQTIAVQLKVYSDINGTDIKEGTLKVNMTDRVTTTPVPVCTFDLATSTTPLTCNVMVKHGGDNQLSTEFTPTANFTAGTLENRSFPANAATVTVQTFSLDPAQVIEGGQATVTFRVTPVLATTLVPQGLFNVATNFGETCSATLPAQNQCTLTFNPTPLLSSRNITVQFGDNIDYVPITATINNYTVLHATTLTITSTSANPQVLGPVTVYFQLAVTNFPPANYGLPAPAGTVTITASQAGTNYSSCTTSVSGYAGTGSCAISSLRAGSNILSAVYTPSSGSIYGSSTSAQYPIVINKVNATFALVSQSSTESYIRDSITFTIKATMTGVSPTGTAIVIAQNANLDQVVCQSPIQLSNGQGSCTMTINSADTWDLYYTYSGDQNYNQISTPEPLNAQHTTIKYPTETTVTGSTLKNNNLIQIDFSIAKLLVNNVTLSDAITGSVTVSVVNNPTNQCKVSNFTYDQNTGTASGYCQISNPGTAFQVIASYSGNDYFANSQSKAFSVSPN